MPDTRIQYILRERQISNALGVVIGPLEVSSAELVEETGTARVLRLEINSNSINFSAATRGRWIQIIDIEGEFGNPGDAIDLEGAHYNIQTIRRVVSADGTRRKVIEAYDPLVLLASSLIPEYKSFSDENKTIGDIIDELLAIKNSTDLDQWERTGPLDPADDPIRSINIQNDSILRAVKRLTETVDTFFLSAEWSPSTTKWKLILVKGGEPSGINTEGRLLVGHNVKELQHEEDSTNQINLLYLFGRGEGSTQVRSSTVSRVPDQYWTMNGLPFDTPALIHDITAKAEHMTPIGSPSLTNSARSPDVVLNGDTSTLTDWTATGTWTIDQAERRFNSNGVTTDDLVKDLSKINFAPGDVYTLRFTIIHGIGSVLPTLLGVTGIIVSSDGTFEMDFTIPDEPFPNKNLVFDTASLNAFIFNIELRPKDGETDEDIGGIAANAIRLNGTSQLLHVAPSSTYNRGGSVSYSVGLWFRIDSLPPSSPELDRFEALWSDSRSTPKDNFLALGIETNAGGTNTRIMVRQRVAGVNTDHRGGFVDLRNKTWYHATLVYNGTEITVYLDFIQDINVVAALTAVTYGNKVIGGVSNGTTNEHHFDGWVDDVRLYEFALTKSTSSNFRLNDAFDNAFYRQGYVKDEASIQADGIFSRVLADKSITNPDTLFNLAAEKLAACKDPINLYEIDAVNLRDVNIAETLPLNGIVRILDPEFGIDDQQIVTRRTTDLGNPRDMKIELASIRSTLIKTSNEVFDLQDLGQKAPTTVIGAGSIVVKGTFTVIDIFTGGQTTIDGGNITADTITADKINVDELAAIQAIMGDLIINKSIVFQTGGTGVLRSFEATAFEVGQGFFLDENSGTPRMFIGDADIVGSDKVTNGDFSLGTAPDATDWTREGNWVKIGGGVDTMRWTAGAPSAGADSVFQAIAGTVAEGVEYTIRFEIKNFISGAVKPQLGGIEGPIFQGDGKHEARIIAGVNTDALEFIVVLAPGSGDNPALDIDNVELFFSSDVGSFMSWDGTRLLVRGDLSVGNISASQVNTGTLIVDRVPYSAPNSDPNANFLLGRRENDTVGQDHNDLIIPWKDFIGNTVTGGNKRFQIITNKPNVVVQVFSFYDYRMNGVDAGKSAIFLNGVKQGIDQIHEEASFSGRFSRTFTIASTGGHIIDWCFAFTFLNTLGTYFNMAAFVIQADSDSDLIVI